MSWYFPHHLPLPPVTTELLSSDRRLAIVVVVADLAPAASVVTEVFEIGVPAAMDRWMCSAAVVGD